MWYRLSTDSYNSFKSQSYVMCKCARSGTHGSFTKAHNWQRRAFPWKPVALAYSPTCLYLHMHTLSADMFDPRLSPSKGRRRATTCCTTTNQGALASAFWLTFARNRLRSTTFAHNTDTFPTKIPYKSEGTSKVVNCGSIVRAAHVWGARDPSH